MANEVQFGYAAGKTLKYGAYAPGGATRTAAGTALTEQAGTGYYYATDAAVLAGDAIIVTEGAVIVGAGEYLPAVTATAASLQEIEDLVTTIDTNLDTLIVDQNKVLNVVEDTTKKESYQVTIG